MGIIFAVITVLAWGSWLAPSQNVPMKGQHTRTFYVTLAVLLMAIVASFFVGLEGLNATTFWFPFLGGVIWTLTGWSAFVGASKLGMARAFGIWAPMNIVVGIIWGVVLFGEFLDTELKTLLFALAAFFLIIGGILLIVRKGSGKSVDSKMSIPGLLGTLGAGIGFATYFIPIQIGTANTPEFNMWIGTLPMAIGMFACSSLLMVISGSSVKLEKPSHYFRVMSTGILWGTGNYGALAMMEILGTGRGFTIAQLGVVVNALLAVYVLKEPHPKSKAAKLILIGVVIATTGAILLGNLK